MRPPRRLDVPDIAAYMQCSANRELFKEPEPAIRRVSATSEAGGYPETVRGVLQSDRQIEAT